MKRNIIYKFCCKHSFYRTQIARKVRLHEKSDCTLGRLKSRMSFIYKYEISTLTPFVKPHAILNLAVQTIFYIQYTLQITFMYSPGLTIHFSNLVKGEVRLFAIKSRI